MTYVPTLARMSPRMSSSQVGLDEAVELTRTGDVWLFRGSRRPTGPSRADRTARSTTSGMSVVARRPAAADVARRAGPLAAGHVDRTHQRGVQLHDLRDAVLVWGAQVRAAGWLRQLDRPDDPGAGGRGAEDRRAARRHAVPVHGAARLALVARPAAERCARRRRRVDLETAYCAEVVAVTYEAMGLLRRTAASNWYDPGRFWSGDELALAGCCALGEEIAVILSARDLEAGRIRDGYVTGS